MIKVMENYLQTNYTPTYKAKMAPLVNPTHFQGINQMVMYSDAPFSITNQCLHILTSDCCTALVTSVLFKRVPECCTRLPTHTTSSQNCHKVNIQFRAVNVISSWYPNAFKGVNCLFCIRQVLYPKPLSTEILSITLQYDVPVWKDVSWETTWQKAWQF